MAKNTPKTRAASAPKKTKKSTESIVRAVDEADKTKPAKTGVVVNSENSKLRAGGLRDPKKAGKFQDPGQVIPARYRVAATYRSSNTCAAGCIFRESTKHPLSNDGRPMCYPTARIGGRPSTFMLAERDDPDLTDTFKQLSKIAEEAAPNQWVRHLVSGDVASHDDNYIEAANALHAARPDLKGWGYTHAGVEAALRAKGFVMNVSTETPGEAAAAIRAGAQAVIVSPEHDTLHGTIIEGRRVQRCPNELNKNVGCVQCGICASNSPNRTIIEFVTHGNRNSIKVINSKIMLKRENEAAQEAAPGLPKSLPVVSRVPKPDAFDAGKAGI